MNELLLELQDILNKVQLLKKENLELKENINNLENINRQLKVEVHTLTNKFNLYKTENKGKKDEDIALQVDLINKKAQHEVETLSTDRDKSTVIERLSDIESEINECLQMLENKS